MTGNQQENNGMRALEEFIKETAEEIRGVMDQKLKHSHPKSLYDATRYLPMLKGKRLRPIMSMLVANAFNGNIDNAREFGSALELVHNFTLVHDDIMDDDDMRRGKPTVHIKYDQATAINAGDALFAKSFEVLTDLKVPPEMVVELVREVALMSRWIVEGQQMDVRFETRKRVSQAEYIEMIEKKTAVMFQTAAKGGAMISGCDRETVEAMAEFGKTVGIGFQVWDDVLDIIGNEKKLGKPVGSDIRKGKHTIMIIHALNKGTPEQLAILENAIGCGETGSQETVQSAIDILQEIGSIDMASKMAQDFADTAKHILDTRVPESDYKNLLHDLIDYMVMRER
jgi:geranylgeranyl diphosphate synthase, type I